MLQLFSENIQVIEELLGYTFKNKDILRQALTHKSYSNENPAFHNLCNERMEFLGDAILELFICEYLYNTYPDYTEAELSKIKSYAVRESTIARAAQKLKLGSYLLLGKGEENTGGRQKSSLLSDAFEAIVAAIYLDGGFEEAKNFILKALKDDITELVERKKIFDFKTRLQEVVQSMYNVLPKYKIIREYGPK
ncbi:MAG: ribonuclease III, partial [Nitrospirae bacterium]